MMDANDWTASTPPLLPLPVARCFLPPPSLSLLPSPDVSTLLDTSVSFDLLDTSSYDAYAAFCCAALGVSSWLRGNGYGASVVVGNSVNESPVVAPEGC